MLFDIRHRRWSQPMLQALEVDAGILPRVVESTEISGVVTTASPLPELGIHAGIPIVGGGADNAAGAVGCGATDSSVMQVSVGTSGAVVLPSSEPHVVEEHEPAHLLPLRAQPLVSHGRHHIGRQRFTMAEGQLLLLKRHTTPLRARGGADHAGQRRAAVPAISQR